MFRTQGVEVTASSVRMFNGFIWVNCDSFKGVTTLEELGFIKETATSYTAFRKADLYDFSFSK